MGLSQSRKQRRRRKIKQQEKEQQKQCVSDTLSSLLTPFSPSLGFSSWLEVSGGLWAMKVSGMWQKRSKTLRSGTIKGGGDWSGGRCQGGVHPQVLQLCPTGNGRNHPPCCSLWILWSQKGESVPPLSLQHLRLHHPPTPDRRHRLHQR